MNILNFDKKSPKIFQFLFDTDKIIKLYGICGSNDEAIDKVYENLGPNVLYSPVYNKAVPHNTVENYFRNFRPDCQVLNDKNELTDKMSRMVFWLPETGMNIREQQKFVNTLIQHIVDLEIEQKEFEIIIVTNSLFILSDIPSGNVNVYNTEDCSGDRNFFAANLYDMLANFSPDTAMGKLSSNFAEKIIKMANDYGDGKSKTKPNEELVNFIGDNIICGYIKRKTDTI